MKRYTDPFLVRGDTLPTSYYLNDGLLPTFDGSTEIDSASLFPVSLKISNPVTGQPSGFGSFQIMVIEVLVVLSLVGAEIPDGFKHAYTLAMSLAGPLPLIFKACNLN